MGSGGRTVTANAATFPAIIGNGMAMSLGYLEGCGLNTPHVHPRGTEFNVAVNGTLRTGMISENGARFVFTELPPGSATIFPRGAIHFEMNLECEPTLFVAAFNNEDPGGSAVAQRFFGLPPDIVEATLDSLGIIQIANLESKIPNNVAQGTKECRKRCGIPDVVQNTTQREPRISANALPSGFSGPPPEAPPPPPPVPSASMPPGALKNAAADTSNGNLNANMSSSNDQDLRPFLIALLTINGVFVVGTLTALFMYVARKRGGRNGRMTDPMAPQFAPLHDEKDTEYYDPYHRSPSPTTSEKR